jgi:hypothetical protein
MKISLYNKHQFFHTPAITQQNDARFEEQLRIILERQRQNFPCGWPDASENGVEPLDPLFVPEIIIEARGIGTS